MTQIELNKILIELSALGQLSVIKEAIRQGANIHAKNDFALEWAAKYGCLDIINYLRGNHDRRN